MHKSVCRRFECATVLVFDRMKSYRPTHLKTHVDFKQYFVPDGASVKPPENPQCVADDIEAKWERAGHVGQI
jgi:hypothetical protein